MSLLFSFFVHCLFLAPLAPFFDLNFALYFLFVFTAPIVDALTFGTSKFYKKIL